MVSIVEVQVGPVKVDAVGEVGFTESTFRVQW